MIWIVYRTTCKINGKFYIGVHKTETDEIFDGYYGNGIQIPKHTYSITHPKYPFHFAFKKYGQDQFYRETLAKFDNPIDAYKYEAKLVTSESGAFLIDLPSNLVLVSLPLAESCSI